MNMIKSYWTKPDLTPEQHKKFRIAAALMREAVETKPNVNGVIRVDVDKLDKL